MKKIIVIAAFLTVNIGLFAQGKLLSKEDIIYTNPSQGSIYNNPETSITIGFLKSINTKLLDNCNLNITNSKGQVVIGDIIQPQNQSILLFKPKENLSPWERYKVEVSFDDRIIYHFSFFINTGSKANLNSIDIETYDLPAFAPDKNDNIKAKNYREKYSLPDEFPAFEIINSNHPGGGYYFLNRAHQNLEIKFYLIIMDTLGFPIFYKEIENNRLVNNFAMQEETGYLSYWDQTDTVYYEIDSSYNIINSYSAKNGYTTDGHELQLKSDGTYWVLIYDKRIVDMSEIVPDGQENVVVTGLVIQQIDEEENVLFEWKSWDHFEITDADPGLVNLSAQGIDYVHGNALDFDFDGNILISSRNMSEITKINVSTGDVMWRWGGTQNQFEFVDDTLTFSAQHNIRYLGNNIYSLFDNGNVGEPRFSRGLFYELDTEQMTATLIANYNHFDSMVFSPFMGSIFTSENNERVSGWSFNFKRYVLSEYDSLGNILLEIRSIDTAGLMSYRVEKNYWETNALSFDKDEVFIDDANVYDTVYVEFELMNNLNTMFDLNGFNSSDSAFQLLEELPVEIDPGQSVSLNLIFIPTEERSYHAAISLFTDNQQFRNSKQFRVSTSMVTNVNNQTFHMQDVIVTPNPASSTVFLTAVGKAKIKRVSVYNLTGQQLMDEFTGSNTRFELNVNDLQSGTYLLKIETDTGQITKRVIVN